MDNRILYKWMEELRQQTRFAMAAFQSLKSALNSVDTERVFLHVSSILTHAAMVSRILWPTRPESRERGERLRAELQVKEDSPLALKDLHREWERPDERYEDWLGNLENPNYVDMNVMPAAAIGDFKQDAFHRSLDPDTFQLQLRGVTCELRPVTDELRKLESAVQFWLRSHHPW